jgi:hypothetical protein
MVRWAVNFIRLGADYLGTVAAPTEREAIERAAKTFDVKADRIVLTRLDDSETPATHLSSHGG